MARKSFTLQKSTPNVVVYPSTTLPASTEYYGSYLKYPAGGGDSASAGILATGLAVLTNDDTRLKSDGLLLPPILNNPAKSGELLPYISFFEANITDYNEIVLTWDAPLNDLSQVGDPDQPVSTEIVIVYSDEGEPQTISDGNILVNDNTSTVYYHNVLSGKWAYYTLFVKFESKNGDLYYEPCASLSLLTPNRYTSVESLYARIPEYYRLLDGDMDTGQGGPLYRYLSVFGYEIDKMRTIIDHLMIMKDPQVANSQALDYISQDLGIGLRVHELGASRLRALINIIGYLRRSEGTKSALELAVQALTGSDTEIDTVNKTVKVYAQRVNLLKDPNITVLVAGLLDAGAYNTSSFNDGIDSGNPSVSVFTETYDGGNPSGPSTPIAAGDQVWTFGPDNDSGGSVAILQTSSAYVRVKTGDILYFSMQKDLTSGNQDSILNVRLMRDTGSALAAVAISTNPKKLAGINYWELKVDDGYPDYIDTFLFVDVPASVDAANLFGKMLLERSIGGFYFDGDTTLGGWLVDSNTIADYRWYNQQDSDSSSEEVSSVTGELRKDTFSVYNSNYSKTRAVVHRMLSSYLPITELTTGTTAIYPNSNIQTPKWHVTFNHIPGVVYGVP